jgi:hypothetical protein
MIGTGDLAAACGHAIDQKKGEDARDHPVPATMKV